MSENKVLKALFAIADARDACKNHEVDLVQERKSLDSKLNELGAGDSAEHRRVSREYVVCIRAIEYERHRLRELADKADQVVKEARQGKFNFASIDESEMVKRPTEDELFAAPDPAPAGDVLPVGRPGLKPKPEEPDPSKGDGVDEHLKASVKELDMPERLIGLCENAGKTKVGHLADILDGKDGDLSEALDCEAKDAKAIAKAVKVYRDKHRKAAMKAEGIEA